MARKRKKKEDKKPVRGRPAKEIDAEFVERMLERGATVQMICAVLRIAKQTFYTRAKEDPRLAAALEYGRDRGDCNLHHAQYRSAVDHNNVKMQQWLGVQRLGQSYRPDPLVVKQQQESDIFTALGVDPQLLSDDDIYTLLDIVKRGQPKQQQKPEQPIDN